MPNINKQAQQKQLRKTSKKIIEITSSETVQIKSSFLYTDSALLRVLSTRVLSKQTFLIIQKKFMLVFAKQHLKFSMVTTKSFTKKRYRIIQRVLES